MIVWGTTLGFHTESDVLVLDEAEIVLAKRRAVADRDYARVKTLLKVAKKKGISSAELAAARAALKQRKVRRRVERSAA